MNFEELSFVNLVGFYREELQALEDGGSPSKLLTTHERRTWKRKGLLERTWKSGPYRLTPRAREVLESVQEYLVEVKGDWETR